MTTPRLELHVWGPGLGLPSLDAECLAALAYVSAAVTDRSAFRVVHVDLGAADAPGGRGTAVADVPALHDLGPSAVGVSDSGSSSGIWTTGGFAGVVEYLRQPDVLATGLVRDLDAAYHSQTTSTSTSTGTAPPSSQPSRGASAAADLLAYTTHLRSSAPPLVALSLYASAANWAASARPAWTALVPWPLGWVAVPTIRRARVAEARPVAQGLGLDDGAGWLGGVAGGGASTADGDGWEFDEDGGDEDPAADANRSFLKVPDRLAKAVKPATTTTQALLRKQPETARRLKLEALAADCLDVLAGLQKETTALETEAATTATTRQQRQINYIFSPGTLPSSYDCLALAYLTLMLLPDPAVVLPRPWLPDFLQREYPPLCIYVESTLAQLQRTLQPSDIIQTLQSSSQLQTAADASHPTAQMELQTAAEALESDAPRRPVGYRRPSQAPASLSRAWTVGLRFGDSLLGLLPGGIGGQWKRWKLQKRLGASGGDAAGAAWQRRPDWLLATLGGLVTGSLVVGAAVLLRSIPLHLPQHQHLAGAASADGASVPPTHVFRRRRGSTEADESGAVELGAVGDMLVGLHGFGGGGGGNASRGGPDPVGDTGVENEVPVVEINSDEVLAQAGGGRGR